MKIPVWQSNDFTQGKRAHVGQNYQVYINWRANDSENDTLNFKLLAGPAWLSLANSANGKLVGTPAASDSGWNTFTVSVSDGSNRPDVEATMKIKVLN